MIEFLTLYTHDGKEAVSFEMPLFIQHVGYETFLKNYKVLFWGTRAFCYDEKYHQWREVLSYAIPSNPIGQN